MNLLVVEPDDIQAEIYQLSLAEAFYVDVADCFETAQIMLRDKQYHIAVCEWEIKGEKATSLLSANQHKSSATPLSIVVVSEDAEEDTMVEAYNGGVSFYFTKPYNVVPFYETLLGLQEQIETRAQLEYDNKQSKLNSVQAVNRAAIYRLGMETLCRLSEAKSVSDMANITLAALSEQGIHAALEFRHNNRPLYFDSKAQVCDDTTVKVFTTLRKQGASFLFGHRIMLNAEHVSMLIKQVDNNELQLQNVLIDLGNKFMPLLNMRYMSLMQEQALFDVNNDIHRLVNKFHEALLDARDQKHKFNAKVNGFVMNGAVVTALDLHDKKALIQYIQQEVDNTLNEEELINADALLAGIAARMHNRLVDLSIREIDGVDEDIDEELRGLEYF